MKIRIPIAVDEKGNAAVPAMCLRSQVEHDAARESGYARSVLGLLPEGGERYAVRWVVVDVEPVVVLDPSVAN